jgi:hypothetical protein
MELQADMDWIEQLGRAMQRKTPQQCLRQRLAYEALLIAPVLRYQEWKFQCNASPRN